MHTLTEAIIKNLKKNIYLEDGKVDQQQHTAIESKLLKYIDRVSYLPTEQRKQVLSELSRPETSLRIGLYKFFTPLQWAIFLQFEKFALRLIPHVDINVSMNNKSFAPIGETALHIAASKNLPTVIKALVTKGTNIDSNNSSNETPLHVAIKAHAKEAVETLLVLGANINAKTTYNSTALDIAKFEYSTTPNSFSKDIVTILTNHHLQNLKGNVNHNPLSDTLENNYASNTPSFRPR